MKILPKRICTLEELEAADTTAIGNMQLISWELESVMQKTKLTKKFTRITSPTVFTLMGRNRGKRNLRDRIAEKMSQKLHISHSVAISMFPYLEIMFENNELAYRNI